MSAPMHGFSTGLIMAPAQRVRVQRNGNSKVLPVPAELARTAAVELGETYTVELAGDDVIYHRTSAGSDVRMFGEGTGRFGVVSEDEVVGVPARSSVRPLDWDF